MMVVYNPYLNEKILGSFLNCIRRCGSELIAGVSIFFLMNKRIFSSNDPEFWQKTKTKTSKVNNAVNFAHQCGKITPFHSLISEETWWQCLN